jgi:hypothetical protein
MSEMLRKAEIGHFSVPSSLIKSCKLASLSPEAIKLFMVVVWRMHHFHKLSLPISNESIAHTVGLYAAEIRLAQDELLKAKLLCSRRQGMGKSIYSLYGYKRAEAEATQD